MKRILPIFCLLALTSLFNHSVAADIKPGGIGFPSGAVKDADVVKLLYGNTLQTHSNSLGTDLFYYINKAGKVKICAGGISACDEAEWSIRNEQFCLKHPRINSGYWFCLYEGEYNDKTGALSARTSGTDASRKWNVYRGDMGVVDESIVRKKKVVAQTEIQKGKQAKINKAKQAKIIKVKKSNTVRSEANEDQEIRKLELKLQYLRDKKVITKKINLLKSKIKILESELGSLRMKFESGN